MEYHSGAAPPLIESEIDRREIRTIDCVLRAVRRMNRSRGPPGDGVTQKTIM